ncbi:hypothetical protein DOY81_012375, partial [Sarcophaga bullata]
TNINITISEVPPNCVQMLCKFVCFNGKSNEVDKDIDIVSRKNNHFCSTVEELRLYNYEFKDKILRHGFLGNYSDRVEILYLASSNISDIEAGSFANGAFQEIHFENLRLQELRKDFFLGINNDFSALSIMQKDRPLRTIYSDFLCHVKYQIKYLTIQAGLNSVQNLTGGDYLLNNLLHVDFSYNSFGGLMDGQDFSRVSMVQNLDLSHSNLEYLPAYIFFEIAATLDSLDLSFNNLKTISRNIFGWREIARDLKIYANDNEWLCSCKLHMEMKAIFMYQRTSLECAGPEELKGWSVFDGNICNMDSTETSSPTNIALESTINDSDTEVEQEITMGKYGQTTELSYTTAGSSDQADLKPDYISKDDLMKFQCLVSWHNESERMPKHIQWPVISFDIKVQENLQAEVIIDTPSTLNSSFGLIWFSRVTTHYYKMEVNYKEYGLGCYKTVSYANTILDLMPNTAYTFCVVVKENLPISPFSCRSIHMSGNLAIQYSAWLTKDQRITGLSLVILGIIMFSFAGILMIYLLLKRKPILLKGSKRVTTTHNSRNEIVVLPKDNSVQKILEKEEKLARKGPFSCSQKRRNSTDSVASYQSYINSNLMNSANLVQYAEIPHRAKRLSNDPLPLIPNDPGQVSVLMNEPEDKPEYAQVGSFYMLDSRV